MQREVEMIRGKMWRDLLAVVNSFLDDGLKGFI